MKSSMVQLDLHTGHRGVLIQGTVSTKAPYPTLRYCEGGMGGMDEMGCLVPVGHKDKGGWLEQQALRVPWPKEWWGGLHKVGEN